MCPKGPVSPSLLRSGPPGALPPAGLFFYTPRQHSCRSPQGDTAPVVNRAGQDPAPTTVGDFQAIAPLGFLVAPPGGGPAMSGGASKEPCANWRCFRYVPEGNGLGRPRGLQRINYWVVCCYALFRHEIDMADPSERMRVGHIAKCPKTTFCHYRMPF